MPLAFAPGRTVASARLPLRLTPSERAGIEQAAVCWPRPGWAGRRNQARRAGITSTAGSPAAPDHVGQPRAGGCCWRRRAGRPRASELPSAFRLASYGLALSIGCASRRRRGESARSSQPSVTTGRCRASGPWHSQSGR